jgi:hypothetical protein
MSEYTSTMETSDCDCDCEAESITITHEMYKTYTGKLRLLGTIHATIAPIVNHQREIVSNAFFGRDDNFIPDTSNPHEFMDLHTESILHANIP